MNAEIFLIFRIGLVDLIFYIFLI